MPVTRLAVAHRPGRVEGGGVRTLERAVPLVQPAEQVIVDPVRVVDAPDRSHPERMVVSDLPLPADIESVAAVARNSVAVLPPRPNPQQCRVLARAFRSMLDDFDRK